MIQSIEKGRKEDGNRSIADKIIKRLHDIEMTVESNHGRWAWELLQNAKDSVADIARKVSVEIELNSKSVVFRHNGKHFSEKDIRGLINQISSKEIEEGKVSKQTGKFGTGFLTTHLLSRIIQVEGIVETDDMELYRFSFPLNRTGNTTPQLIPQIENAWTAFHKSTEGSQISTCRALDFNTSFTFNLTTQEQKEIARIGVDEFVQLIPFVLAFIPVIDSVSIVDNLNESRTQFKNNETLNDGIIINIIKKVDNKTEQIHLLYLEEDDVAISAIVEQTKSGYTIKSLDNLPKLFCDFPLIGTEDFHFPVIVNSFHFNPLMERDGIWLKGDGKKEVEENREILEKAVSLYGKLLSEITQLDIFDFYNICLSKLPTPSTNEKYFDEKWYQVNVQKPLRELIYESKVIETEDERVLFNEVRFPDPGLKKEDREKIWQFSTDLRVNLLPAKKHIHKWASIIWHDCPLLDIDDLVVDLKGAGQLDELANTLKANNDQTITWLNNCIEFIYQLGGQSYFNENEIIPNQEGEFKKRKELSKDCINDETLKEIAALLGYNVFNELIHSDVVFEDSQNTITIEDIAASISKLINNRETAQSAKKCIILADLKLKDGEVVFHKNEEYEVISFDESDNSYEVFSTIKNETYNVLAANVELITSNVLFAIRKLVEWFEHNPENGRTHFEALYRRKEKLFVDTIEDKDNLYRVLKSKTPLSKLSEVAKAIEEDPELLEIIIKRKKEKEEEKERNEIGELIEKILAEALNDFGLNVSKEIYGKDLAIVLKKKKIKYAVEVKSTSQTDYVSMTPFQAKTAVAEAANYALCVVPKNDSKLDVDYIQAHAKFVMDIGAKLKDKFNEVSEFEKSKSRLVNTNDDIDLFYQNNLDYRYKISSKIWLNGVSFKDFIGHISEL